MARCGAIGGDFLEGFFYQQLLELGKVIVDPALQRTSDSQITVADLTGVAVQDIQISKAVYQILAAD